MKILATIGTTQFDQLINTLYENADKIFVNDQLILQYGQQNIQDKKPKENVTFTQFIKNLSEQIQQSDLIISTASAGSRLDTILQKKPHIMVCNDTLQGNHQLEMIKANKDNKTCLVFESNKAFEKWIQTNPDIKFEVEQMNKYISQLQEPKDLDQLRKIYKNMKNKDNNKKRMIIVLLSMIICVVCYYLAKQLQK